MAANYANTAVTLMGFGAASDAVGTYWSARLSKLGLDFQADMADINARIAELGAQQELLNGQEQIGQLTLAAGKLKSRQRVTLAANGVDLGEGSAAELQASTDIMKEIDVNTVRANAVRSAWGYRTRSVNYQNESTISRASADGVNPTASAGMSLLGSAGQVASTWYLMNRGGSFNSPSNR